MFIFLWCIIWYNKQNKFKILEDWGNIGSNILLQMFLGEWFWMVLDDSGCLQIVLDNFRWFSVIHSFSSYCEIRWLKFRRTRQLRGVFVVSSNNDAKVPLNQITKFLGNSKYKVSLKRTLVEFCLQKVYICSFM